MIEVLTIDYINCERCTIDYDYRKTHFNTEQEMLEYKKYLEKKLGKKLYFTFVVKK